MLTFNDALLKMQKVEQQNAQRRDLNEGICFFSFNPILIFTVVENFISYFLFELHVDERSLVLLLLDKNPLDEVNHSISLMNNITISHVYSHCM